MHSYDVSNLVTVISNVGIFVVSVAALLIGLLIYYRKNRDARYDKERHQAELEMLRASIEKQIYSLTDRLVSTEARWEGANHLLVSRLKSQPDTVSSDTKAQLNPFLRSYGINDQDLEIDPKLVFVLMPFNSTYRQPFDAISKACRDLDLRCVRGDEQEVVGDLLPHILRYIVKARVIISIVDGRNPNVFYELGLAHALGKSTILITRSLDKLPFDLRTKKLINYRSANDLYQKVQTELARTLVG